MPLRLRWRDLCAGCHCVPLLRGGLHLRLGLRERTAVGQPFHLDRPGLLRLNDHLRLGEGHDRRLDLDRAGMLDLFLLLELK